jgi:hypothetical protein
MIAAAQRPGKEKPVQDLLKELRTFLLRGNLVDTASES